MKAPFRTRRSAAAPAVPAAPAAPAESAAPEVLAALCLAACVASAAAYELSGKLAGEAVLFPERPRHPAQIRLAEREQPDLAPAFVYPAFSGEVEWKAEPSPGFSLTAHPFVRYDVYDRHRTLFDLPEAKIAYASGGLRARLGFETETWGVMEYVRTTDVLNQDDVVDAFLAKRKLGQAMAAVSWIADWGVLDAYALAGFRPMPLPGSRGRPGPGLRFDGHPRFGSDAGRLQPEGALRYSGHAGPVDFSLDYFHGYERVPRFRPGFDDQGFYLRPDYLMSHQAGADAVWVAGAWIFKTENAVRFYEDGGRTRYAWSAGLERGFAGVGGTPWDLTAYLEYLRDTREPSLVLPFTDDVFAGLRLYGNDRRATEAVVSLVYDRGDVRPTALLGELSARPWDRFKLSLGGAWLIRPHADDPFGPLEADSHLRLRTQFFF